MSIQAFGAAPPPETPAPAPETPAKRSPLLLFGAPALAALLVAGGLAYVLLGGGGDDGLATGVPPSAPAPSDPTPSPSESTEAPRTVPLSASRNPFDPLVREPAGAPAGGAPLTSPGSGPTGPRPTDPVPITSTGGSVAPGSGIGSGTGTGVGNGTGTGVGNGTGTGTGTAPSGPPVATPSAPAPGSLDAVATCKAGDDLWTDYRTAMTDTSTTHTMAGHSIGPVTSSLDALVITTSVEELRQPLRTWARASASVRTQLVTGTAVRDVEPSAPLDTSTGGTPKPGTRPVVDQSSILLARTAVRERCYQLTDPLVTKDSL